MVTSHRSLFSSRRAKIRATVLSVVCLGAVAAVAVPANLTAQPARAAGAGISLSSSWSRTIAGKSVSLGSPGVGTLDGEGASVIVGTASGVAVALHTSDGSTVNGWPHNTGITIMSTPSTSGTGSSTRVFFGLGVAQARTKGGYLALSATGKTVWYRQVHLLPNGAGELRGVQSSLTVGNLQTGADVIGGAMGQMQLAMGVKTGHTLKGFPWLQADTNFSTPAVANIYSGKTRDYIFEGGDSTAGRSYNQTYKNGGHIRILSPKGFSGKGAPNDGLVCQLNTNQVVQSSPAVGNILDGNKIGVVVGTGTYYKGASDTNKLIAMDARCGKKWTAQLDGSSAGSPALADILMRGELDVVEASGAGTVYALNGSNGHQIWKTSLHQTVAGSVTTFEFNGNQYVLAPTEGGLYLLDGATGDVLAHVATDLRIRSSATVTRDPNGQIGITVAGGYRTSGGSLGAKVEHFRVDGSNVSTVQTNGAWPMFHHDPQLTGYSKLQITS